MQPKRKVFLFLLILFLAFGGQIKPGLAIETSPYTSNRFQAPVLVDSTNYQKDSYLPLDDQPQLQIKRYLLLSLIFEIIALMLLFVPLLDLPHTIIVILILTRLLFNYLSVAYFVLILFLSKMDYQDIDKKSLNELKALSFLLALPLSILTSGIIGALAIVIFDIVKLLRKGH